MANILFVTSEMIPFATSGGLGEVSEGLPAALAERGHRVTVIMPLYGCIDRENGKIKERFACSVRLAWRHQICRCHETWHKGVRVLFVEHEGYFQRPNLYGSYDDGERFAFFCAAVMAIIPRLEDHPDILHCNDWQTALCLPYLRLCQRQFPWYQGISCVYTIHNMEYQGLYDESLLSDLFGLSREEGEALLVPGGINLTAGAIRLCDRLVTVSPSYAQSLTDDRIALGLGGIVLRMRHKLSGIVNGIDVAQYDPERSEEGLVPFSASDLEGKWRNRESLRRTLGLAPGGGPIVAMVTRLAGHKGIDLMMECMEKILSRNCQFVLLGSGESRYEQYFQNLSLTYPDRVSAIIGFDRGLAKRIYASSDLFLMPSSSEACGVAQMIASRYGTVPLVHQTGGLIDTVDPYNETNQSGDGFGFSPFTAEAFLHVYHMAMDLYEQNPEKYDDLRRRAMRRDRSWDRSAGEYEAVYLAARGMNDENHS